MKKARILFIFLFLFICKLAYSQNDLSIENLRKISVQKKTIVYITGLWCLPCMKKLKETSDSLLLYDDDSYNYIVVFDRVGFNWTKLKKMNLSGFDSTSFFLIPKKYYSRSFIQFNPSTKALRSYIKRIESTYQSKLNFEKFWFSDAFLIEDNKLIYPISAD
jgi:hypothetical protein